MFDAGQLTEEQKEQIKEWVAQGAQMADVQRRLQDDFGFKVTYMDTRFLSLDLGLEFLTEDEPVAEVVDVEKPLSELGPDDLEVVPGPPQPVDGGLPVTVAVDSVGRPGAMVSGTVSFSDGEKGTWLIDQMGRLSVDPDTAGYRPSEQDLFDFQERLREQMDKM